MANKLKDLKNLKAITTKHKKKGERVVFTNGCFDILHLGHLDYLQKARKLGDKLIVAVNSDSSVRKIKPKPHPIVPEKERAKLLTGFECVDYVTIFRESTPLRLIKTLKPNILVKGADWKKKAIIGKSVVESYGGKVATVKFLKNHSTSLIIKKIKEIK